jgi:HEAT repeat protein
MHASLLFRPGYALLWAGLLLAAPVILIGCSRQSVPGHPLAVIAAELDAAVAAAGQGGGSDRIRELLAHELPDVRAMAAQAAAAAGAWECMPALIELIEDEEQAVAARAAAACATLLGMDHGHDAKASADERATTKQSIRQAYETMNKNPPPQYRK